MQEVGKKPKKQRRERPRPPAAPAVRSRRRQPRAPRSTAASPASPAARHCRIPPLRRPRRAAPASPGSAPPAAPPPLRHRCRQLRPGAAPCAGVTRACSGLRVLGACARIAGFGLCVSCSVAWALRCRRRAEKRLGKPLQYRRKQLLAFSVPSKREAVTKTGMVGERNVAEPCPPLCPALP